MGVEDKNGVEIVKKNHKYISKTKREREREYLRGSENLRSEEALRRLRNKTFAIYRERGRDTHRDEEPSTLFV